MFSFIIPYHNDAHRLQKTLHYLQEKADSYQITQIVLCHNGPNFSQDDIPFLDGVLGKGVEVYTTGVQGVGAGYKLGLQYAKDKYVIFSDSDFPFGFSDLDSFLQYEKNGLPDYAIGSKAHPDSQIYNRSSKRTIATIGFYLLRVLLLGHQTPKDSQGSIIVRTDLARTLVEKSNFDNYLFKIELATLALQTGIKVCEIPIVFHAAKGEPSSVSVFGDGFKMALGLFQLRRKVQQ
ncbi:MAG: glycosyltransferase [SAR324 cluster bacterium]|nr:glycosyltransferase [SAR324 cluster bacterium]